MNEESHKKGLTKEPVSLEDGTYEGLRYGYTLEIGNEKFTTREGIRCTRKYCGGPNAYLVADGKVFEPGTKSAASILAPMAIGAGLSAAPSLYDAHQAQQNPSFLQGLGLRSNDTDWGHIGRNALGGATVGGMLGLGGYLGGRLTNFLTGNNRNFTQKVNPQGEPVGQAQVKRRNFLPGYLAGGAGTYMLLKHLNSLDPQRPKSASEDLFELAEQLEQQSKRKVKTPEHENGPKGMPENGDNEDYTDPISPENSKAPEEQTWTTIDTITGSGNGSVLGG